MRIYKKFLGWSLVLTILLTSITSNTYAQPSGNAINLTQDEELVRMYVESVNTEKYFQLPELFCESQSMILSKVIENENNQQQNIGI